MVAYAARRSPHSWPKPRFHHCLQNVHKNRDRNLGTSQLFALLITIIHTIGTYSCEVRQEYTDPIFSDILLVGQFAQGLEFPAYCVLKLVAPPWSILVLCLPLARLTIQASNTHAVLDPRLHLSVIGQHKKETVQWTWNIFIVGYSKHCEASCVYCSGLTCDDRSS